MRLAAALTKERTGFSHREPHLLARFGEFGVMSQRSSAAQEDPHPVTSEFLSDASPLKPLILGLPTGASKLPAPLKAEVESLMDIPSVGLSLRGPHAKAQRVSQATCAAGWPWAWPRIQLKRMRCHRNNRHLVTRTLGTRKFQASHARNGDAFKEVYLALAALGCSSVQVDEQPHAELMYAAVHEDAAPAKGRHFGRLDTELMLLVDFLSKLWRPTASSLQCVGPLV